MRSFFAILAVSTVLSGCAGCMDWGRESSMLREAHGRAIAEAACTNQFDVIPPLEDGRD